MRRNSDTYRSGKRKGDPRGWRKWGEHCFKKGWRRAVHEGGRGHLRGRVRWGLCSVCSGWQLGGLQRVEESQGGERGKWGDEGSDRAPHPVNLSQKVKGREVKTQRRLPFSWQGLTQVSAFCLRPFNLLMFLSLDRRACVGIGGGAGVFYRWQTPNPSFS